MLLLVSWIAAASASAASGASSHSRRMMTRNYRTSTSGPPVEFHWNLYTYLLLISDVDRRVRSNQMNKSAKQSEHFHLCAC